MIHILSHSTESKTVVNLLELLYKLSGAGKAISDIEQSFPGDYTLFKETHKK